MNLAPKIPAIHRSPAFAAVARRCLSIASGCALLIGGLSSAKAQFTYTEDFTGTTAQGWNFVQGSSGQGDPAFLTAAQGIDSVGQGWLRLASSTQNQANAVWFDSPIPAAGGSSIQISFSMAMYNQTGVGGGDGIGFFLWDASSTFNAGAYGGSLAYAPKTNIAGLSDGYVGVGFDVFGNYSNPTEGRTGGPGLRPEAVAIRGGPSSGYANYDYLAGTNTPYDLDFPSLTTRPDQSTQYRNVRVTLNPILDGNGVVTGTQVIIEMQFGENGLWQTMLTTDITGSRPDELRMGFSGATGDAHEIYEINNLTVAVTASGDSNIWDNSSGNSIWNNSNPTNWYVDFTPSDRANVIFNDSYVTSNQNISLIGTRTISGAYFGGTYSYVLNSGSGATLIFDTGTSTQSATIALLNSPTGNTSHQINVPIVMNTDLTVYNYAGQTLTLGGAIGTTTTTIAMGSHNFINQGNGTTVVTSTMSGTGGIFENGAGGKLILAGNNTYTGLTTVSAGALIAANSGALGSSSSGTVVYSGATLGFSNSGTIANEALTVSTGLGDSGQGQLHNIAGTNTFAGTVALTNSSTTAAPVTMAADAGTTLNITGVISGNTLSGVNKIGDGTIIFSGTNSYAGATTISGGILQIAADSGLGTAPGSATPGYLTFNGGTLAVTANTVLNQNRGILLDTMSGTIQVSAGTTTTYNGAVAGTGSITKTGDGTLLFTSTNSYTGDTNINAGNLIISTGASISNTGSVNIANVAGATFTLSNSETIGALSGGGTTGGAVNLNGNTLTTGGSNTSTTFAGVISGTGGVTKTGTGTFVLAGSNTYTGATTVNNGTLALGNNNVLANTSSLILNGGTLAVNGYTDTVGTFTLSSSSTIDFGSMTSQFTLTSANTPTSTSSILFIDNWTGSLAGGSGSQLFLTNTNSALLSQIQFEGYAVGAVRLATGEVVPSVVANGYYWNNSQTNWATANAWNNGAGTSVTGTPNATDALAVFGKISSSGTNSATTTPKTVTLSSNQTLGYAVFNSTQGTENYTLTGSGTLIFSVTGATNSAYINMTSSASNLIAAPIALSSSLVISQNGTGTLTLSGAIATNNKNITVDGSGNTVISSNIATSTSSLTKTGTGTLTLSGTSSYSGGNNINGGTVAITADRNLGATGHTTSFSNGTLAANATLSLSGNVVLNSGGGTINVTNSATVTSSGNYIGTGTLSKTGEGTLILGGNNTYSGATNINAGTLIASSSNAIGDTSAVTIADVSGARLVLSTSETIGSLSGGGSTGGNLTLNANTLTTGGNNASTTYSGIINGTGGLTKTGSGTMVLDNNSSTYSGLTSVTGGELIMAASNALGTGAVTVANGAMLTLSNASGITATSSKTLTLSGSGISNSGALNNEVGNNTWQGNIVLAGSSTIGNASNLTLSGTINGNNNTLTVSGAGNTVISGVVSGTTTALIKTGTGTTTLSGANTYGGSTTVSGGILAITSNTALGSVTNGTNVANGASLALSNNITVSNEALTIAGGGVSYGSTSSGVIQSSGSNTITGAVAMSLEPGINVTNGILTMSGVLSGTSGMSKDGPGTLVLSGNNSYNGAVSVNSGILAVQSNNALGTASTSVRTTVNNGATVQFGTASSALTVGESFTINGTGSGGNGVLQNTGGNNTVSGLITMATDSTIGATTGTTISATNVINGAASLTKVGAGTLVLSGTNTYTGSTNINGGTVVVSSDANLGTAPTTPTTNKLTFDGGTLQTANAFTLDSDRGITLNSGGGTIAVTTTSASVTYGGIVAGTGNLTVSGSGRVTLAGNNTYTGNTTVNGATLAITGDQNLGAAPVSPTANNITLNNGGTLAISASTTIDANRGITVSGTGGVINTATGTTTTYGGSITGSSSITKSGSGTLALDADNVISSSTSVILNGGTLATNGNDGNSGAFTLASSSTIDMGGFDANSVFTFASMTSTSTTSNVLTIANWTGSLDGGVGSQLVSSTTVSSTVLATINFTGYGNGAYQIASTGEIVPGVIGGARYWDTGSSTWSGGGTGAAKWNAPDGTNAGTVPNSSGQVVVFGAVDAAGHGATLTNSGAKTVTLSADRTVGYIFFNSTYSGENYTIAGSAGNDLILSVTNTTSNAIINMSSTASNTISAAVALSNSLAITQNGTGTLYLTGGITTNGKDIYVDGSGGTNISGAITGTTTSTLFKDGSGTLTLSGTNSYAGGTYIEGGTIAVTGSRNLGVTGNALTFSGGTLAANGTFSLSSTVTLDTGGGTINTSGSNTVTLTGNVIGTGDFTKDGTGTVILTGNNTYSGTTTINGGTLVASNGNAIGNSSAVVLANVSGAQLVLSSSETIGSLSGGGATGGNVVVNTGTTLTTGGDNTSTTYAGAISGAGGVTKTGTGTMVLSGNNTYTGATNITQGTLMLGADNVLSDNSNITMAGGTTLALNGHNESLAGTLTLSGNSTIDMGSGIGSEIHFANSAAIDWGSNILTIANYDVVANNDYLYFGTSAAGLNPGDIGQIRFLNPVGYAPGLYYAMILADGRIVPIVPEPSTIIGGILLTLWILWRLRHRLFKRRTA